jgi:hypothetical protein
MSTSDKITGSCLCGAVHFEITPPYLGFWYCHCERCQKSTGSAHAANIFMKREQFRWLTGEDNITIFKHPTAEDYPRAFCKTCGSPVPRFARDGVRWVVQAGLLETDPGIRPQENIFWPLHAPWYETPDHFPKHDARPPGAIPPKK